MDNTTEPQATEMSLSNTCSCEVEDETTGELTWSNECFGCFDEDKDYFKDEFLMPYLNSKGWDEDTIIRVIGERMNWDNTSGWTEVPAKDLLKALAINGDYTLRVEITSEKELTITRSSHDEYGASFRFELSPEQEYNSYEE
jgi:hypothetical protein